MLNVYVLVTQSRYDSEPDKKTVHINAYTKSSALEEDFNKFCQLAGIDPLSIKKDTNDFIHHEYYNLDQGIFWSVTAQKVPLR